MTKEQIEAKMNRDQLQHVRDCMDEGLTFHSIYLVSKYANIPYRMAYRYIDGRA